MSDITYHLSLKKDPSKGSFLLVCPTGIEPAHIRSERIALSTELRTDIIILFYVILCTVTLAVPKADGRSFVAVAFDRCALLLSLLPPLAALQ